MKRVLLSDKLPYLLTLMFVAFGWLLTKVADQESKRPIMEYDFEKSKSKKASDSQNLYTYTLTNISDDMVFKGLEMQFIYTSATSPLDTIVKFSADAVPPAIYDSLGYEDHSPVHLTVPIGQLYSGASMKIQILSYGEPPIFRCKSSHNIKIIKSSIVTMAYKNYHAILLSLPLFWIVVILIYIHFLARNSNTDVPKKYY